MGVSKRELDHGNPKELEVNQEITFFIEKLVLTHEYTLDFYKDHIDETDDLAQMTKEALIRSFGLTQSENRSFVEKHALIELQDEYVFEIRAREDDYPIKNGPQIYDEGHALNNDEYKQIAHENWIKRKVKEIDEVIGYMEEMDNLDRKIVIKSGMSKGIRTKLTDIQIKRIYDFLSFNNRYIPSNTSYKTFKKVLTNAYLHQQPRIEWQASDLSFYSFLAALKEAGVFKPTTDDPPSYQKIEEYQLFVNRKGKPFSRNQMKKKVFEPNDKTVLEFSEIIN